MPISSQALYFHLGMNADDDGFINPKTIMRTVNIGEDDLKILIAKRFLLEFESGVVVIKHWLIHNMIRADRYKQTRYTDEKKCLIVKENSAYSELATKWQPNGNQMATQVRLGEVRLGKVRIEREAPPAPTPTPSQQAKEFFENEQNQFTVVDKIVSSGKYQSSLVLAELPKFISYWTEPSKSGKKQRWELESAFEVTRRLVTWLGRATPQNKGFQTKRDYTWTGGMTKAFETCGRCVRGMRDGHVCSCVRPLNNNQ